MDELLAQLLAKLLDFIRDQLGQRADLALFLAGLYGSVAPRATQAIKRWLPPDHDLSRIVTHRSLGAAVLLVAWACGGGGAWWAWAVVGACGTYISELGYRVGRHSLELRPSRSLRRAR